MKGFIKVAHELLRNTRGQATVEAAFMLPIVFTLLLLLIQPCIVLYDRVIMQQAAAEGCRVLITSDGSPESLQQCEDYIRRRLSAVPQQDCFHVHEDECSWNIELTGSAASDEVGVSIATKLRPLPLLDAATALVGMADEQGHLTVEVETSMPTQPTWFANASLGTSASSWVGAWLRD